MRKLLVGSASKSEWKALIFVCAIGLAVVVVAVTGYVQAPTERAPPFWVQAACAISVQHGDYRTQELCIDAAKRERIY